MTTSFFSMPRGQDLTDIFPPNIVSFPAITTEEVKQAEELSKDLHEIPLAKVIDKYKNDLDELAKIGRIAAALSLITVEQFATLLEARALFKVPYGRVNIHEVHEDSQLLSLFDYGKEKLGIQETEKIRMKPHSEQNYFVLNIPLEHVSQELLDFLYMADETKAIRLREDENTNEIEITLLSVGARDVLTQLVYKEQAKKLFPRVGEIDMRMIDSGLQMKGRYAATSYPGIEDSKSFHDLIAPLIFIFIHDEIHRQVISAIPNDVFDAILLSIKTIREKTGRWNSKDIWQLNDMDLDEVRNLLGNPTDLQDDPQKTTELFAKMISGTTYSTSETLSLFLPNVFCDTTWLLMIDMFENREKWAKLHIDPNYLPMDFKIIYDFVEFKYNSIKNSEKNLAKQIVHLKSLFLRGKLPETDDICFSCPTKKNLSPKHQEKNASVYLEIMVNGKPQFQSKADLIADINRDKKRRELFGM